MRRARTAVNQGWWLMVYNWLKWLRSGLFPAHCRLCLAPGGDMELCPACRADLPWLTHSCQRCALPLPAHARSQLCPTCLSNPPALDHCHALFSYQPPVDQWIHALKFNRDLATGRLLGELLAAQPIAGEQPAASLLPVPLHRARLRQRGYNQAMEIARPLLRLGWRLSRCDCRRTKRTEAQSGLPARHRRRNIRGAFTVRSDLEGQTILLIDDVMTTGATLNELARTLKVSGAGRVEAWVIARALKRS
jgi:ComF family protein